MTSLRIAICTGQIPFARGGAEVQAEALCNQLQQRGHAVEMIRLPFRWYPKEEVLKGYLAWRLINLDESEGRPIDRVIALKFPGYVIRHNYKITWLIQQFRQAYELFGTPYSHFVDSPCDVELREAIIRIDTHTLSESRAIFTIARNTGSRLYRYNHLQSEALYPPPALDGRFYNNGYGDYIFCISRLSSWKRVDQLVRAMAKVKTPVHCRIAGQGDELANLQRLASELGVTDRVDFLGFVSDEEALTLFANALAIFYAPMDEEYGYATVEAMKSQKSVLTTTGSGGILEFVEDGITGFVTPADDPTTMARRIDELFEDRKLAERLGTAGLQKVKGITWGETIDKILTV